MHMIVERVSYLHEDELMELMNDIKHSLRPNVQEEAQIVQKAITFVRRGAVDSYLYDSANRLAVATIVDEDEFTVRMAFDNKDITCTCHKPDWCAHRVAVIFHLYLQFHSLTDWTGDWRRMETEQMALKIADRTPSAWNNTLSQLMNPIRIIGLNENPAVFIHKFSLIEQNATSLYPFEWEWKPLFDIYYRLHAMEAAWPYIHYHLGDEANSFSYGKWYVRNWVTEQFGKIQDAVSSLATKPKLFETDPFYDELKNLVRTLTLEQAGLFDERFRLYRTIWQHLFSQKLARENEQAVLEKYDSTEIHPLLAFFYIIGGQYDKLEKQTESISLTNFAKWLPLADVAEHEDEIEALSIIMHALLPFIRDQLIHTVRRSERADFVRKIDGLLEAAQFPENVREKMFSYYGETGVDVYADFLVERERYNEWAALMHRYRVPYEIANAGGLKLALKTDPASALPLLHLYAMNFIEERNRQSYRRAVSIFKKMKAASKKSGKHDFWNRYVDSVREKYRRLRALMEEMEKGNLNL